MPSKHMSLPKTKLNFVVVKAPVKLCRRLSGILQEQIKSMQYLPYQHHVPWLTRQSIEMLGNCTLHTMFCAFCHPGIFGVTGWTSNTMEKVALTLNILKTMDSIDFSSVGLACHLDGITDLVGYVFFSRHWARQPLNQRLWRSILFLLDVGNTAR